MFTLLRKIRQSLIKPGQFQKYLFYAIGEILLVMIGILLALHVNNWNENKKLEKAEIKLLKEMRAALIEDQNDIISNILEHKSAAASCEILRRLIKEDIPFHDSLKVHFSRALNTTRFVHTSGPYETLKIKGPDLIKNDDLRLKLSEYYDKLVGYQFDLQKSSLESFDKAKERQFELFVYLSLSERRGMEPVDFEELKQSLYYKSWLNYTYGERRWEVRNFEVLKEKNEQLVDLIELEIIKS